MGILEMDFERIFEAPLFLSNSLQSFQFFFQMNVMKIHVKICQKCRRSRGFWGKICILKSIQKTMALLPQSEPAEVQIAIQKTGGMAIYQEIILWSNIPFDSEILC